MLFRSDRQPVGERGCQASILVLCGWAFRYRVRLHVLSNQIGLKNPLCSKTLTMMYKMVAVERDWVSSWWGLGKPRQLFVTRSQTLVGEVQRTVKQLLESFQLAHMDTQQLRDLWKRRDVPEQTPRSLPKKWSDLTDNDFPLFLSFDQVSRLLSFRR